MPQDIPGLIRLFGGDKKFAIALNRQFELAAPDHFVALPDQDGGDRGDYDNEPAMELAYLFNFAHAPWLTQK